MSASSHNNDAPSTSSPQKKDARLQVVAGMIAGACEATATWPMEYIKTQLQTFRVGAGAISQTATTYDRAGSKTKPPFTGVWSGLTYTVRNHGFLGLYAGLTPTLVFSIPKAGIRFGSNQFYRNMLKDKAAGNVSPAMSFVAGLLAGITEGILVVTPQETIKTKLINLNMAPADGIRHIVRTQGIGGLYTGMVSTCMKQGGNHGSRFMFMSEFKRMYAGHSEAKLKPLESFAAGMGAGIFSIVTTTPFDVVKTRMQSTQASAYKSTADCFSQIARREGLLVFYSGALARCFRVVPGQGIIFMSAEAIYNLLEKSLGGSRPSPHTM